MHWSMKSPTPGYLGVHQGMLYALDDNTQDRTQTLPPQGSQPSPGPPPTNSEIQTQIQFQT